MPTSRPIDGPIDRSGPNAGRRPPRKVLHVRAVPLDDGTRTRFVLVWLTRLPPVSGGYRGEIADVTVRS